MATKTINSKLNLIKQLVEEKKTVQEHIKNGKVDSLKEKGFKFAKPI